MVMRPILGPINQSRKRGREEEGVGGSLAEGRERVMERGGAQGEEEEGR